MSIKLSRRDFMKLSGSSLALAALPGGMSRLALPALQSDAKLTALWVAFDPLLNASQKLFGAYTKANGTAITVQTVPFSDWDRTIRAVPMQDNPPDLMIIDGPNVLNYAVNGIIAPVDKAFTQADLDDFLPGTKNGAFYKKQFYGPATNESSQAVIYNKKLVAKYNIDVPDTLDKAWTWADAKKVFAEIQTKERAARGNDQFWAFFLGQGGALGAGTYTGEMLIRSNGEKGSPTFNAVSDDGLTTTGYINTPEALEAFQFLQDMYQKDGLIPSSETPDFFYNEQVAFWLTTPVYVNVVKQQNPNIEIGVMPVPYHKTPIVHTDSFHIGVAANSKNVDEAAKLVAFLTSPDGSESMAKDQGVIPQRASVLAKFPDFATPPMKLFIDTVQQWAVPRPITPGYSEYDTIYQTLLTDIATGAPVKETVDKAAADIDAQLAKYKAMMG